MTRQPNILFILSDQHRWSGLNCYGNPDVISPTFDRMSAQGVRYTRCVSSAPVCCPYRATVQTGLHAHQHGVRVNKSPWLGQHFRGLPDYFNEAGYHTCYIGKVHWGRGYFQDAPANGFVPPGARLRWQHWYGMPGHSQYDTKLFNDDGSVAHNYDEQYQPTVQTDLALEAIREFGDTPWLIQLNWGPPHSVSGKIRKRGDALVEAARRVNREYGFGIPEHVLNDWPRTRLHALLPEHLLYDHRIMPEAYLERYDPDSLDVPPNVPEQFRRMVAYHLREYYGLITSLDDELARIFDSLAETGRDRDTLVVYTSDHGDKIGAFCQMDKFRTKSTWHQNSVRVPLVVWGPGVGVGRGKVNNTPVNSVDLLPTLVDFAGRAVEAHLPGESLVDTFTGDCPERERDVLLSLDPWRGIYDGRYLYAIEGSDDSCEAVSLVDTVADPYDLDNLVDDPAHTDTRTRLGNSLARELYRTSDYAFLQRTGFGIA